MEYTSLFHVCLRCQLGPIFDEVLIIFVLSQTKQQLDSFLSHHTRVQESFVNGKPPHLIGDETFMGIQAERAWTQLSSAQVQEKMKTGPIILFNEAMPSTSFDRELFTDMLGHGNMSSVLPIEGEVFYKLGPFLFTKFYIQINPSREKRGPFLG
jgi:hypothetical protein